MKYRYLLLSVGWAVSACQAPVSQTTQVAAFESTSAKVQKPEMVGADSISRELLLGKVNPSENTGFVKVGMPYSEKSGMWLQKEAFEAFKKMFEAAKKDGVTLKIISSTRTFEQQKAIWERKWKQYELTHPDPADRARHILQWSSMPGTSRHHWGTDLDLNDLNNPSFEGKGKYAKVYEWLANHAGEYGFAQPYTPKGDDRPNGYNEEKWHWSYTPLAIPYRTKYLATFKESDITGFQGADTAKELQVVENYVGGVAQKCQ